MGPQRRLEIYVGFESPSIIKYLEPMTDDQFTARYLDCQFNETIFPVLGGEDKEINRKDIAWNATSMSFLNPRTNDSELEIQRIIHLQSVANRLPDAFIDTKKVTKSHIPAENIPTRLEILEAILTEQRHLSHKYAGSVVDHLALKMQILERERSISSQLIMMLM
ncbi:UNVERIFIED_CONTAM: hypothetical protein Scaly_2688200 [Sesamum calycinum]|uniref:Uncharacterized protein n=1 Tax=Sesamum calycinum TaxID=2727403 RepID=A0AAW2J621_9LAMI